MGQSEFVWLNDELMPGTRPGCVDDRGFQYGDGLFETLRVQDGRPHFCRST
jgi:branched-subunit amino acid aminotransferase/4-amino-4-deoxychorismate lyase